MKKYVTDYKSRMEKVAHLIITADVMVLNSAADIVKVLNKWFAEVTQGYFDGLTEEEFNQSSFAHNGEFCKIHITTVKEDVASPSKEVDVYMVEYDLCIKECEEKY